MNKESALKIRTLLVQAHTLTEVFSDSYEHPPQRDMGSCALIDVVLDSIEQELDYAVDDFNDEKEISIFLIDNALRERIVALSKLHEYEKFTGDLASYRASITGLVSDICIATMPYVLQDWEKMYPNPLYKQKK